MTRYELLDRIGVGGMAEIFRGKAVAAGGFEKPVAIKRILPHLSQDKRFVELLIAEAKVLSLLKHRNIVQIFDVGLGDDGQYFLVMEYVDGRDLGAVQRGNEAKRKRLPFHLALHIGAEVCEALEHAHAARAPDGKPMALVHRDVSPSNVLLSRAGEIKLTDFGIAKRAEAEQTGHGAVRGKFAYISPEQARNEHIEPRSDVFSVGILMWEMVTGRRLFSGLGDLEALRAVREAQVAPPSTVDRSIGSDFDALLMSALSKDIKRRPTAGVFGEKLRTLRYSLEATGGDPATELAGIIDLAEEFERESSRGMAAVSGFDSAQPTAKRKQGVSGFEDIGTLGGEATVIRIRTAAEFGMLDTPQSISDAKRVIDRFEDEETRLAPLSGDQMRMLRSVRDDRDSGEIAPPPTRHRRPTDEPTTARPPIDEEAMTMSGAPPARSKAPLHEQFEADEATRLVAPTNRRTPPPERVKPRAGTQPPLNLPGMTNPARPNSRSQQPPNRAASVGLGPPAMPDDAAFEEKSKSRWSAPGTVHNRNPTATPDGTPIKPARVVVEEDPFAKPVPTPVTVARRPPPQSQQPPSQHYEAPSVSQSVSMSRREPMNPSAPVQQPMQQPYAPPQQQPWPASQPQMQAPQRPSGPPDMFAQRPSTPGYQPRKPPPRTLLQPWMLVVGALIMAALAFLVTRAFIAK